MWHKDVLNCLFQTINKYNNVGMMTLLVSDYLISCRCNSSLSNYRFILYLDYCSFTGVDSVSLKATSLLYVHWFIIMSPLFI